jgi:hypothetical protein
MVSDSWEERPTPGPDLSFLRPHKDFWADATSSSLPRPSVNQHSRSISDLNNPKANINQVELTSSSRKKRPRSYYQTSAQKKLKLGRSAPEELPQKSTQNSTPAAREEAPGFDEYLEEENLVLHGAREDDGAPDSEDDAGYFDIRDIFKKKKSNLKNSNVKAILENNNDNTNLKDNTTENNIEPNPHLNPSTNESNLQQSCLDSLDYSQLKEMCTNPDSRVRYGDEALINTTVKAIFNKEIFDEIHDIDRTRVAKKYHSILDQVIFEKARAMAADLDDDET